MSADLTGNKIRLTYPRLLQISGGLIYDGTGSLVNISQDTGSFVTTGSFNSFTSSINTFTSSIQTEVNNLTAQTGSFVTTSSFNNFTASYNTGSFTGSFTGDGSGLTNLSAASPLTSIQFNNGGTFGGNQNFAFNTTLSSVKLGPTGTQATGQYSFAQGLNTVASDYSIATGRNTSADGAASHAGGFGTATQGNYQTTVGQYNIKLTDQGAFIIGNGTNDLNRSNLLVAVSNLVQITGSLDVTSAITASNLSIDGFPDVSASLAEKELPTGTQDGQIIQYDTGTSSWVTSSYTLPTTDGTPGQVLTTNGSGAVTFQSPSTPTERFVFTGLAAVDTAANERFIPLSAGDVDIATNDIRMAAIVPVDANIERIAIVSNTATTNTVTVRMYKNYVLASTSSSVSLAANVTQVLTPTATSFTAGDVITVSLEQDAPAVDLNFVNITVSLTT